MRMKLVCWLLAGLIASLPAVTGIAGVRAALAQSSSKGLLKPEQLDQLLSPVALYPDNLLSQVMIASTYPLEVVEADRWATANKNLKDDALKAAIDKQKWDDSVKALAATPTVLNMMSTKLDWTQKLGDAVLAQQADVMDAVQRLRSKADAQNKLTSTKEQKVTKTTQENKQVIVIEPVNPSVVYVPYYNPAVVYGPWAYPAYPPYYFPPPGYIAGAAIATGVAFATGVAVAAWVSHGGWWGGNCNWGNNNISINNNININNNNKWVHNTDHRGGVRYNNDQVRQQFSKDGARTASLDRNKMDFRGHDGKQVLKPGAGQSMPGAKGGGQQNIGQKGQQNLGQKGAGQQHANRPQNVPNRHQSSGRGPGSNDAFSNVGNGRAAHIEGNRGHASVGNRGGGGRNMGGGHHGGGGRRR